MGIFSRLTGDLPGAECRLRVLLTLLMQCLAVWTQSELHASSAKDSHKLGLSASTGFPHLVSGELRVTAVPHFEFGFGLGGFPVNRIAQSLYSFEPVPIDMQTSDTFVLAPTGTYSLSSVHAFARWFPGSDGGFFVHLGIHSITFGAKLEGSLRNETLGTSLSGAMTGNVTVVQPLLLIGPGYQFLLGEHFHIDMGAALAYFLPAGSNVNVGGTLSSFAVLNAEANESYEAAKRDITRGVSDAMAKYQSSVKVLPSIYLTLGYLF